MKHININEMDTEKIDYLRKTILLKIYNIFGVFISSTFIILYTFLGLSILIYFAIFSLIIFMINFILLKKKKHFLVVQFSVFTIILCSVVDSYFIGWNSYFWLFIIPQAITIIHSFTLKKMRWKVFEVFIIAALLILLLVFTRNGFRIYSIDPKIFDFLVIFNFTGSLIPLLIMESFNFYESYALRKRLLTMSEIDALTGAYNRRFFNKYLDIEIKRYSGQKKYGNEIKFNFAIAMIDIDNFKIINDTYGHFAGDKVLTEIAHIIKSILFERDVFCRYGGEEFVILFTGTSKSGAGIAVEKIRKTIDDYPFFINEDSQSKNITVSIGFAIYDEESDLYKLINLADKRMYKAKRTGKNRVVGI
ncbi:MAG: GGDEF domain-containing protein [Spirochaetales bacterium]|nr:GGDEF domain-containing protein [Spirochaetales bacterium]